MCMLEGFEAVYICRANAAKLLSTGIEPGTRLPAHTLAGGRLILSFLPEAELDIWLNEVKLIAYTPLTVIDKTQLKRDILKIRKQGYGLAESQLEIGLRGVSVPLLDGPGRVVGALSVSMSTAAVTPTEAFKLFVPRDAERGRRVAGAVVAATQCNSGSAATTDTSSNRVAAEPFLQNA